MRPIFSALLALASSALFAFSALAQTHEPGAAPPLLLPSLATPPYVPLGMDLVVAKSCSVVLPENPPRFLVRAEPGSGVCAAGSSLSFSHGRANTFLAEQLCGLPMPLVRGHPLDASGQAEAISCLFTGKVALTQRAYRGALISRAPWDNEPLVAREDLDAGIP